MGPFPARITAQDFVTPPEFSHLKLALEGSGRIGGTRISLDNRGAQTRVVQLYEQIPIRVSPLSFGDAEPALIYLINPTAGLMDGDAHLFDIHAEADTRAVITGQSASRMHPCLQGFCTQQWRIKVADGAVLVVLPGPAIPYNGTRFFQRIHVELGRDARFIWGDVWYSGRYARAEASERFRFECVVQEMVVQRAGELVYRDRFAWHGPWSDETAEWHFADQPAVGNIFITGSATEGAHSEIPNTRMAIFSTFANDTCYRLTGSSDSVIRAVVRHTMRCASNQCSVSNCTPWLITNHQLACVHWFDVS